jgi:hypothetical protein
MYFEEDQNIGIPFMKRLLGHVDLLNYVDSIEERFLQDGDKQLLMMVVDSLQHGRKVQVKKFKAVQEHHHEKHGTHKGESDLKLQDKENIKTIFEMFNGDHSKQFIENLYFQNDKNFERTLE